MGNEPHWFEPWSTQTSDFKIDTCYFLAMHSALLGYGKEHLNEEDQSFTIEISAV